MIKGLTSAKNQHMHSLVSDSVSPYVSDYRESHEVKDDSAAAYIQRKLHPEKQALNEEELKQLIQCDELGQQLHQRTEEGEGANTDGKQSVQNGDESFTKTDNDSILSDDDKKQNEIDMDLST